MENKAKSKGKDLALIMVTFIEKAFPSSTIRTFPRLPYENRFCMRRTTSIMISVDWHILDGPVDGTPAGFEA
jgi:hypothetical protein